MIKKPYVRILALLVFLAILAILIVLGVETAFPNLIGSGAGTPGAPLTLVDDLERYPTGTYMQILNDDSRALTLEQVTTADMELRWQQSDAAIPNFGFTDSAVWLRLKVENRAAGDPGWLLDLDHPYLDQVDFYKPDSVAGKWRHITAGTMRTFQPAQYPAKYFTFPLEIPAGDSAVYYLRLASQTSLRAPLTVWSAAAFQRASQWSIFLWGGVLGFFLLFGLYRLIQFIAMQEPSYLFIAVYCFSVAFVYVFKGMAPFFVIGAASFWRAGIAFGLVNWISLLLFADSFLALKQHSPRTHRAVRICVLLLLPLLLLAFLAGLRFNLILTYAISVPLSIFFLIIGLNSLKINRNAHFILPALAIPLLVAILQAGTRLGLARFDLSIDWIPVAGNLGMVMLLSLAQSDRILCLQKSLTSAKLALQESEQRLYQYLQAIPLGIAVYDSQMRLTYINPAVLKLLGADDDPPVFDTYDALNRKYQILRAGSIEPYPPEELPTMRVIQTTSSHSADDIVLVNGSHRIQLEAWSSPIFDSQGRIAAVVNIFADIGKRREMEVRLARINTEHKAYLQKMVEERTRQEQRQRKIAESMQHSATALSSEMDLNGVLAEILDRLEDVILCSGAAIYVEEGEILVQAAGKGGIDLEFAPQLLLSDADHPAVIVFNGRRRRVLPGLDDNTAVREKAGCLPYWIGVPMLTTGDAIGVLVVKDPVGEEDTEQILTTLEAFASHAAIAIANARLLRQAGAAAALEERNRLARDLHDAVTQTLFSVSLIADSLPALWQKEPAAAMPYLQKLNRLARSALAEMRNLLLELRPSALAETSFTQLLTNLKDAYSGGFNIPLQVDSRDHCEHDLPYEIKIAFYRVAQEALNNLSKHSNAQNALIRFTYEKCGATLIIRDDGRGFDPSQPSAGRMGLKTMRERAEAAGADLEVTSQPGLGTTITLTWEPG